MTRDVATVLIDPGAVGVREDSFNPVGVNAMVERDFPEIPFVEDPQVFRWIVAFTALDQRRDKAPLIKLLKDNAPMPWPVPWHLADLLRRYNLVKRRGNQKEVPSYDYSAATAKLIRAKRYFKHYIFKQISKETALAKAADKCDLNVETLRTFLEGRSTSARRQAKRRPPKNPRS